MQIDVQETIDQLGGRGLSSALAYTGVRKIMNKDDIVYFVVNGRRGLTTTITVRLMPNDTYTVTIAEFNKRTAKTKVFKFVNEVYCDELQSVFEDIYDNHMNTNNHGFIPIG